MCIDIPAIRPYFWKIFSTSTLTTWKVFRFPTNTLKKYNEDDLMMTFGTDIKCCYYDNGIMIDENKTVRQKKWCLKYF